ncbi:MAG: alanine--tRNA ligase, partial [Bacteroidia bacterium]|nr:alanine--tRNA ligase [Bacteroidia bacterium]
PIDLTQLMAREKNLDVDMESFHKCLAQQKERSRAAAEVDTEDWIQVSHDDDDKMESLMNYSFFEGYEKLDLYCRIIKYRKVKSKVKKQFQIVLNKTPFYAESGGQVGDAGYIEGSGEKVYITDTQKENNLIIHFTDKLPKDLNAAFHAVVNSDRRKIITSNHSATHLMHSALKRVLGTHVNQKGSLVNEYVTRFDFSHFAKVTDEEIEKIEKMVNEKIRENISLDEKRNVPIKQAQEMGATALFGEKYGEFVRVITFDPNYSRELCGGTHVKATGQIRQFKIISESSVAAGVRRVEAITGELVEKYNKEQDEKTRVAENMLKENIELLENEIATLNERLIGIDNTKNFAEQIFKDVDGQESLQKKKETLQRGGANLINEIAQNVKNELKTKIKTVNGINFLAERIDLNNADAIKSISFELKKEVENIFFLAAADLDGKPHLSLIISDNLVKERNLDASKIIRELAKEIQGGGGGQAFYATAGGKNSDGINKVLEKGITMIS